MKFKKSAIGVIVTAAVSAATTFSSVQAQPVDLSKLVEVSSVAPAVKGEGLYIIQLKGAPAIAEAQAIGELLPSNQLVAQSGNRYDATSSKMKAYAKKLQSKQVEVAASLDDIEILHSYQHTFNGFSAKLTAKQAAALEKHEDVVSIFKDRLFQPTTDSTPAFLGLTSANGQHSLDITGEGVVVGVLDTGVWPENPSFADDGSYSDPAELGWTGACDAGDETAAGTFNCNNKLVGARFFNQTFTSNHEIQTALGEFLSPRDADGHGSHTASTAAGNADVPAILNGTNVGTVSGIAPRARVAAYKVCWNSSYENENGDREAGCFFGDSMAAIDQAIVDGVDVINYSIGNSNTINNPVYNAGLRAAQAGVFFAASAGNDGSGAGTVSNIAPWFTTVAASTHDGNVFGTGIETTVDGETRIIAATEAQFSKPLNDIEADIVTNLIVSDPLLGCFDDSGVATPLANTEQLAGNVALISRGECAFTQKVSRAEASGAAGVVIFNTEGRGTFGMSGSLDTQLPALGISAENGEALLATLNSGTPVSIRLSSSVVTASPETPNQIVDFSSRGANQHTADIIKPDITAPGVNILAATSGDLFNNGAEGRQLAYLSGTSMSGPHIAGLAALFKQQHPEWSPAQIKSALMTTARQDLTKGTSATPADPFDFGAGHADPVPAMEPGLTYDLNVKDYLAFLCGQNETALVEGQSEETCDSLEEQGFSTDASQLNYPSIAIEGFSESEAVSRTLTDVSGLDNTYTVAVDAPAGIDVAVRTFDGSGTETQSGNLEVKANGKASFELTFTRTDSAAADTWAFGAITLTGERGTVVRSPIAIQPATLVKINVPAEISTRLRRGRTNFPVQMQFSGRASMDYAGLVAPAGFEGTVTDVSEGQFDFIAGLDTAQFLPISAGTKVARFSLNEALIDVEGTDLDLYVYSCTGFRCTPVGQSTFAGSNEEVTLINPEAKDDFDAGNFYIVFVHGWDTAGNAELNYVMPTWVAERAERSTRIRMSSRAIKGRFNHVSITSRGLTSGLIHMGAVTFYNDEGVAEGTTVLEVLP